MINVIISNHPLLNEIKREVIIEEVNFSIIEKKIELKTSVIHFNSNDQPINNLIAPKKVDLIVQNRLVWLDDFSGSTKEIIVQVPNEVYYENEIQIPAYFDNQGNVVQPSSPFEISGLTLSSQTVIISGYTTEYTDVIQTVTDQIAHNVGDYVETDMIGKSPYQAKEFDFYFSLFPINNYSTLSDIFDDLIPFIISRGDSLNNFD